MQHWDSVSLLESDIRNAHECGKQVVATNPTVVRLFNQPRAQQRTPEWFAQRKRMVTASNVGTILGLNPYCTARLLLKRSVAELRSAALGSSPPPSLPSSLSSSPSLTIESDTTKKSPQRKACAWGNEHEHEAGVLYALITGNELVDEDAGLVTHPTCANIGASPDRVLAHKPVLVEIKAPYRRKVVPDEVPQWYWAQIQTQMEVCDMNECHFVQFVPASLCAPGVVSIKRVMRDREWWKWSAPVIQKFAQKVLDQAEAKTEDITPGKCLRVIPGGNSSSNSDMVMMTFSPGLYHVYVDEKLPTSAHFREILHRESASSADGDAASKTAS